MRNAVTVEGNHRPHTTESTFKIFILDNCNLSNFAQRYHYRERRSCEIKKDEPEQQNCTTNPREKKRQAIISMMLE
ncbi:unnamed protein product [Ceratitis capitata]|uniref:(Mediterranean fruit fly) hypothetical protein n=1 Tax=Ceratitis capitata TaxID=7213 RepID=A0A811UYH8_CERCA|nr:unnamed protein product [Ceratitis capitata]